MNKDTDILTDEDFLTDADFEQPSVEAATAEPVDTTKEEETAYSMGKFGEDVGEVLANVASIPSQLYEAGKFAVKQTPEELAKIAQKPTEAAEAAGLGMTISPTASAFVERAIAKLTPEFLGGMTPEEYKNVYGDRALKAIALENIKKQEAAAKEFPLTTMGSKLLTSTAVVAPLITSGGILGASAGFGGLAALEAGEKTLLETGDTQKALREAAKALATQGLTDYATLKLGKLAAAGGKKAAEYIKEIPETAALKAIGATKEEIKALRQSANIAKTPSGVVQALEETKVLKPFTTKAQLAQNLDNAIEIESNKLGSITKEISGEIDPKFVSKIVDDTTKQIEDQILKPLRVKSGKVDFDDPIVKDINNKINELKNIGEEGLLNEKLPTFELINAKKREIGDLVKTWDPGKTTQHKQALRDLYGIVKENIDAMAQMTSKGDDFIAQNNKLSSLFTAKKLTDVKDVDAAEVLLSSMRKGARPTAAVLGKKAAVAEGLMSLIGFPIAKALVAPITYPIKKLGPSTLAVGARQAQKFAKPAAEITENVLQAAKVKFPETYNKFQGIIDSAKNRGKSAVSATNYMLAQQFPEYREMIEKTREEEGLTDKDFLTDEDFK